MSRPVSAEDLLRSGLEESRPKFISRKSRNKRKAEAIGAEPSPRPKPSLLTPQTTDTSEPTEVHVPNGKKAKTQGKYVFDWDATDDTSQAYQPLVTLEPETVQDTVVGLRHWSEKRREEMTPRDWRIFNDEFSIFVKGQDVGFPLRAWPEEEMLPVLLVDILQKKLRFKEPTPIQRAAVPLALRHRDMVGIAETGSGKTLAYLLPLLTYLMGIEKAYLETEHNLDENNNRALGLILAPTRELALQITKEAEKFTKLLGFSVVCIIGGHQYEETIHSLRSGVHIVVAAPGRLVDSLERGIINLLKCYHLTLDEADKMIDMGFEKSLQQILLFLPAEDQLRKTLDGRIFSVSKRTTLMFTATITPAIETISKQYLDNPVHLTVGNPNEIVDSIKQNFEFWGPPLPDRQELDSARVAKLVKILQDHKSREQFSVIIFANYKRVVELLADVLSDKDFRNIATLHGSKSQEAREHAIASFRSKESSVLIATDVAARGLDVPHVSLVVNYQMSNKFEEYIHRIGRTGRAGKSGESVTFLDEGDRDTIPELKKFLKRGRHAVPEWMQ